MNRFHGVLAGAIAILAMTGASNFSSAAYAQETAQGEFQLSQTTHWEKAILPEGKYFYSVEAGPSPAVVRVWQVGGGFSGVFLPKSHVRENSQRQTELVLHHVGDGIYVSSFHVRGLKAELEFSTPEKNEDAGNAGAGHEPETAAPASENPGLFKIVNPGRLNLSVAGAEKVYLNACQLIEAQFNRGEQLRPQIILHLGAIADEVRYPNNEIMLKKWDEFRFAQAVVEIALHDLVSSEERMKLSDAAVSLANTTVSVYDLKNCRN